MTLTNLKGFYVKVVNFRFFTLTIGIVYAALFILSRLWFYLDYPIPGIYPDSASYYEPTQKILNSEFPKFNYRTPGYPVFLSIIFSLKDNLLFLIFIQSIMAFISSVFLLLTITTYNKKMSLPTLFFLVMYFSDMQTLTHETSMLAESLYTSLLILSYTFIIRYLLLKQSSLNIILASFISGLVIITKPAGYFMILIIFAVTLFVFLKKKQLSILIAGIFPLIFVLSLQSGLNYWSTGTISPGNQDVIEINLVTNPFWETSRQYPENINKAIKKVNDDTLDRFGEKNLYILNNSWNFFDLYPIYLKSHYYGPHTHIAEYTDGWGGDNWRFWLKKIAIDTVADNPEKFLKRYIVMLSASYFSSSITGSAMGDIVNNVRSYYIDKNFSAEKGNKLNTEMAKEFANPPPLPKWISIESNSDDLAKINEGQVKFERSFFLNVYEIIVNTFNRSLIWLLLSVINFIILIYTIVNLFRRNLVNNQIYIAFLLSLGTFLSASIVSLVEFSQPRYTYPMEWTYGISLVFASQIFVKTTLKNISKDF